MLFVQWTSLGPLLGVALAASDINTARAPWYTVSAVDQHRRAGLSKTGHAHRGRPTGARPSAAAARATVDRDTYVGVPEYWKCLNTLSGAFYFYDAASQKKYLHGLMEDSPVRPSTDPCETLQKTDVGYKVFNVTLQPQVGGMTFAVKKDPKTNRSTFIVCEAYSWDILYTADGFLGCSEETTKDVNDPTSQAYIGNWMDPRYKSG